MNIKRQGQYAGVISMQNYQLEQEYLEQLERERKELEERNRQQAQQQEQERLKQQQAQQRQAQTPQTNTGFISGGLAVLNPDYAKEQNWKSYNSPRTRQAQQNDAPRNDNYWWNTIKRGAQIVGAALSGNPTLAVSLLRGDNKQKDLFSDSYNTFMKAKNETQIDSSNGKIDIANQMQRFLEQSSIDDYIQTSKQLIATGDRLNDLIDKYQTSGISREESAEMDRLRNQYDELNAKKNEYERAFDYIKQYESSNILGHLTSNVQLYLADVDLDFGAGLGGSLRGFGRNITDLQRALAQRDDTNLNTYRSNLQQIYHQFFNRSGVMREKWHNDIEQDRKDLKRYEGYDVSDYFKHQQELVQDLSLFNPKRWIFQAPELIGASMSAPQKQVASMLTGLAAAYTTGGASLLATGATYGLNLSAGADENFANVAQATKDILQADLKAKGQEAEFLADGRKQLGNPNATVEDIYYAFNMGEYVPRNYKIRQTIMDAAAGSLKQFMQGQGVNTLDATFDTAIEVLPIGGLSKASKVIAKKTRLNEVAEDIVVPIKNSRGGTKLIHAKQQVGKYINTKANDILKNVAEKTLKHSSHVTDYVKQVPARLLTMKEDTKVIRRGITSLAKRNALNSYSEAIEEGLQQEQQYQRADERDDSYFNAADQFVNTVLSGPRLWWSYLTYDPETATEQGREIYQNMQGGILGAWLQGGVTSSAQSIVGTAKEIRLDHAVMNNIMADKTGTDSNIEKGKRYAKYIRNGRYVDIKRKLDDYKAGNEQILQQYQDKSNSLGFPSEMIDDEVKLLNNIAALSQNKDVQKIAKIAGFNDDDYDTYLALLGVHSDRARQDNVDFTEALNDVNKQISQLAQQNAQEAGNTEDLVEKQSLISAANRLKSLFQTKAYLEKVEQLTNKQKLLSKRAQRLIDEYNKQNGTEFKSEQEVDEAAARQGIPVNDDLVESMRNLNMYQLQSELSLNMLNRMTTDSKVAKKEVQNYKKVKKSDEKLRQDIEDEYMNSVLHDYAVDEAVIDDSNNVYVDRGGRTVVAMRNPEGQVEKRLYDNGEIYPDEDPMEFDKEEWYDYQEQQKREQEEIDNTQQELDDYMNLRQKSTLTENEQKRLDKYNEKYTAEEIQKILSRQDRQVEHRRLQETAPYFDAEKEHVPTDHIQQEVHVWKINGPWEFERRAQQEAARKQQFEKLAQDLANERELEGRVANFNRTRKGNSTLPLNTARTIEDLLSQGYTVEKQGNKYIIRKGDKKTTITKAAYDYANTYFVENKPAAEEHDDQHDDSGITEQQTQTLNRIAPFKVTDDGPVKYELRTGMDYFVQDPDGTIRRRSRVHSVLPHMFTPHYGKEISVELIALRNKGDVEGLKKAIRKYEQKYNEIIDKMFQDEEMRNMYHINMTGYIDYCDLINDAEAFDHVLRIFDAIINDNEIKVPKASVISGTIIDDISRRLFAGEDVQYDPSFRMSEETFNKFKDDVLAKKNEFEDAGYVIVTDRYCWYTGDIAGETDMLLIDKDGNIHIVDFKTSQIGKFEESKVYKGNVPAIDKLLSGAHFTSREEYTNQLSLYADMIQELSTIPVLDIRLLGYHTKLDLSKDGRSLNSIQSIDAPQEVYLAQKHGALIKFVHEGKHEDQGANIATEGYVEDINKWIEDTNSIREKLDQIYEETNNADIKSRIEKARRIFASQMDGASMIRPFFASSAQNIYNKLIELGNYYNSILSDYEALKTQQTNSTKKDVKVQPKSQIKGSVQQIPTSEIDRYNRTFIAPNKQNSPAVKRLQQLSANPDFLTNTTFYVNLTAYKRKSNGYVSFTKIVYRDSEGKEHVWEGNDVIGIQVKLASVDENGNAYLSPGRDNPVAQKILQIIRDNENNLDNVEVVLTGLSRTNGTFIENKERRSVDKALNYTPEQKDGLYNGANGDQIGIVGTDNTVRSIKGGSRVGNNEMIFANLSALGDPKKRLVPGHVVIIHDLGYTEDSPNNRHRVPVYLQSKKISSGTADLIISCLQGMPGQHPTINGVKMPITNRQILQMLVRFGAGAENTNSTFVFRYAYANEDLNNPASVDTSTNDFKRVYLKIGDTQYMLSLDNDIDLQNLKNILTKNVNLYANNVKLMQSKLSSMNTSEATNPFTAIGKYFDEHPDAKELRFSDDLVFNRDDIGKFGYHWMMDHGWLTTDYTGVTNPIISATDVEIRRKPDDLPPATPDNNDNPVTPEGESNQDTVDIDSLLSDANSLYTTEGSDMDILGDIGLPHRQDRSKKVTPIQKIKAQKTFKRIVGDAMPIEWLPTLMNIIDDPDVVGMCRASSIVMSEAAESGTDFHEAFHGAVELLMNKKDRQRLYDYYRRVYSDKSDREIAEDLADKFFDYSRYTFHPANNIGKFFAKIWSWIRAMYTTRDITLSRLFVNVDWGKYADGKITKARKEEFKRRFGKGLCMKVSANDGSVIELNHFYTSTQLDDAINTLLYQIVKVEGLNSLGSNAQNLNLNEDYIKNLKKDESGKYVSKFGKTYATLTLPGITEAQLQKLVEEGKLTNLAMHNTLMFRELFDNYRFTQERLFEKLRSMGIVTTAEELDADRENIDAGEENAVSNDIQGHSDEFYTHSRAEDVTSQIKFFLSTRPALRYATQEDVNSGAVKSIYKLDKNGKPIFDRNGNKIRATVPMKVNSLGMVQFLDFKGVHQRLLTALSGVNSVQELYDKLNQLGQNDYLFANIASSLYNMRWQSYIRYTKSGKYDNVPVVLYRGKRLDPKVYVADLSNLTRNDLYPREVRSVVDIKDKDGNVIVKKGDIIQGASVAINADMEALTTQLFQSIKSQHLNFNFTYVRPYMDDEGNIVPGKYTYEYKQTNSDQSQQQFPIAWFDNVRSSYSGLFRPGREVRLNSGFEGFKNAKSLLNQLYLQLSGSIIKIDGRNYDITKAEDADSIYTMFVRAMNDIGVGINKQSLIYTLQDMDLTATDLWPAFKTLLASGDGSVSGGVSTLIADGGILDRMQRAVDTNNAKFFLEDTPRLRNRDTDTTSGAYLYSTNGFIKLLAAQYGKYRQRNVELMTLGAENTKQYTFAQNHTMSDVTDNLNNSYDENGNIVKGSILDDMSKVEYVIDPTHSRGSVMAKQLLDPNFNPQHNKIEVRTSSGVKISGRREGGTKYIQSNAREDYLSKVEMLAEGDIISPTLSDKSTYMSISGFKLPGFDWATEQIGIIPYFNKSTGELSFSIEDGVDGYQSNAVLDQFIEYYERELANVRKTINDLGLYGEKNTATPISQHDKIKNYHTGNINGARFFSLMGIYDENDKYIPFNVYKDTDDKGVIEGYERAMWYFFNQPIEQQRRLVARILKHRLSEELNFLVQNGIITINQRPATDPHPYFIYENKYFDQNKTDRLYKKYLAMGMDKAYGASACKSMAVVAMTFDTMCKSIMSIEETRRFFTGMPQFFKTGFKNGQLTEYGVDETKRYGGLGSTGENNRNDLPNIGDEYTCAEIKDWEIGSAISDTLFESFKECEYREAYAEYLSTREKLDEETSELRNYTNEEAWQEAYSTDLATIEKTLEEVILKPIIDKKIKAESDSYRSGINVADGTAYITNKMAENLLRMRGAYSREVQQAFERLRGDRGYLNSVKDYKTIFNALIGTQKYSAFGYRMQNDIPVHFYNKFALFPIFKGIAYGFTRNLYNKMLESGVDMVMFDSAVKAGSQDAQRFNPELTADEVSAFTFNGHTYKQKYSFIRRQLNTDPRTEEEMAAGTQAMKIALSAIRPGQTYQIRVEENGELVSREVSGEEYVQIMMNEINELAEHGREDVINQFYTDGKVDLVKFANFAVRELSSRNADKNILEALQCTYTTDENGNVIPESVKFPVDINSVSNLSWLETIINSIINKNVIDIKFKGNAYYQRSVFGVDSPMTVISDKDIPNELNGGKPLQIINEEGSMDAVISIDYFKDIIPPWIFYNFNKAKRWLIDNDIISGVKTGTTEWHNATAQTMGYRIPTQALASISALRFVDVIPVVRDTIILPKEFTKVTGSDFDIDKLILSTLYYERSKDGVKTQGLTDMRKNTANNLFRQYLDLLKDRRYDHLNYRSIDNDTELIKDVLSEIYSSVATQVEPYRYETLSNQVNTMQQFATGKIGIGPFALNNNNQILTQLFGVKFAHSDNSILSYFNKDRLDRVVDDSGNSILSWISAFINAHVDIAKDPYITSLNINKATYNMTALLIRVGFGENALYFLNNPIIRDLAEIELQQNGNIIDNPQISKNRRIRNATRDYIKNTFNDSGLNAYFKDKQKGKTKSQVASFSLIKAIFDQGILKDMVVNKAARINPSGPLTVSNMSKEKMYDINGTKYSPFELQAQLFLAKEAFDRYANALSALVQSTKIDTKKQGNTVQQQRTYYSKYLKLMDSPLFDHKSLDKMIYFSFISTKTKYGTHMLQDILEQVSITATDEFFYKVGTICDYIGIHDDNTQTHVTNALSAYIKQTCMNVALEKRGFTSQNWRDMIIGNKTLASRIEGLKRWLLSDTSGKYSALVSNGMIINPLLDNLRRVPYITQFGTEHYDLVTLDNTSDDSQDNSNNYIDAWQQLLDFTVTDDNGNLTAPCKAIRQLANDLATYAFMTSADARGFTKFFKYVPISWRKAIGYSDEISEVFKAFSDGRVYTTEDGIAPEDGFVIDLDDFFLNFAYDNTIIPVTDKYTTGYDGNRYNRFSGTSKGFDVLNQNGEVVTVSEYALLFPTGIDYERSSETGKFPMYIKLQRNGTNRNSPDRYLLYRCIGTFDRGQGQMQPLYGLVTPKGVSIRVGAQTYQFYSIGRDDQYKHIYDKPGKRMTQAQYEDWIDRVVNELQQSVKEGYKLEDLAKYPQWAKFIQSKFLNPTGVTADQLISVRSDRHDEGNYTTINSIIKVADSGYYKNEPQQHPENVYMFTDNAQAYMAAWGINIDDIQFPYDTPKLNVSAARGTNQAAIRTDSNGNITENAFGLVVKKYQQDENGVFVDREGQFEDTDADFELFTQLNEHAIQQALNLHVNGEKQSIVLPRQLALGKAALPRRFAEKLQEMLMDSFGVSYIIEENKNDNYEGYGLKLGPQLLQSDETVSPAPQNIQSGTINRQNNSIQDMATPEERQQAIKTREHCKGKGDKS